MRSRIEKLGIGIIFAMAMLFVFEKINFEFLHSAEAASKSCITIYVSKKSKFETKINENISMGYRVVAANAFVFNGYPDYFAVMCQR